jgi:hypothetical protein
MIQFILTNQIFIIFLMHMEIIHSPDSKVTKLKADIERNPTDIPPVEYQDYLNTKEAYSRTTRKNI